MELDRRNMMIAGATALLTPVDTAQAAPSKPAALRQALTREWRGLASGETRFTFRKFRNPVRMYINVGADLTFDGIWVTMISLDDKDFGASFYLKGFAWTDETRSGVRIQSSKLHKGDRLPGDNYWQGATGDLELFANNDRPGHFILAGKLTAEGDAMDFDVELIDVG